jgi:hypothetical protein
MLWTKQHVDTFLFVKIVFVEMLNSQYTVCDQSKETDETNIILVSHQLIVETNEMDIDEKNQSLEMIQPSRIKPRLSQERRLSDSIEQLEKSL